MGWSGCARTSPVKEAPKSRQQCRRRALPATMVATPIPKTAGASAVGRRREGTQASGKAMAEAIAPPRTITRKEPASGESECVAGFRAFRTIRNSGENAQMTTAQNTGQYGQMKGRGLMMLVSGGLVYRLFRQL